MQYNYVKMEQGNHEKEKQVDAISDGRKCGVEQGYCQGLTFVLSGWVENTYYYSLLNTTTLI